MAEPEGKASGAKKTDEASKKNQSAYCYFLIFLTIIVLLMMVPSYIVEKRKEQNKIDANRMSIQVKRGKKLLEIYKPSGESLETILQVQFGQSIPRDLKPDFCTCDIYTAESKRYDPNQLDEPDKSCFTCLDWAVRANLRVYVTKHVDYDSYFENSFCYDIKWQSYDTLLTPLVDCFILNDEQWLGLGDIQSPVWPLDKLQFDWTPLTTNLSSEFVQSNPLVAASNQLAFGSYLNFSLYSTKGIHIGNLRTDFGLSLKISQDSKTGARKLCISVSCTDKCSTNWARGDHLDELRHNNNRLEYSICSASNLNSLISKQLKDRQQKIANNARRYEASNEVVVFGASGSGSDAPPGHSERLIEKELKTEQPANFSARFNQSLPISNETNVTFSVNGLPEGIGLIERTIFLTSPEFMPVLDGQTLRQHVDEIVKLSLKTSSILLIDTRWETYVGSLKLNVAMFPKAKLLFEILHNKGFKIVLAVKPYIDTGIGISNVNQLFEAGRLYTASYRKDLYVGKLEPQQSKESLNTRETLIRRQSLFSFRNQSIEIGLNDSVKLPYLFRCKESQDGYCVLIDLTQLSNRIWMINSIRRSSLLTTEADGIQIGGAHPNSFHWDDHYRNGVSELANSLFYRENIYTLPKWTGDFGYIELAPRHCDWDGLRSVVNSVLDLGMIGFSLIHPGSVWGDLKSNNSSNGQNFKTSNKMNSFYGDDVQTSARSDEELIIRWLQVSVFLPILQFNNVDPIERLNLKELLQSLVKIRKLFIVPELKRNLPYTPMISQSKTHWNETQLPLIRPVWYSQDSNEVAIPEQFTIGSDILVAPILSEGLRQRDIYLPNGYWQDELRQIKIRGGKWLHNYPVELNEIAWFSKAKR